MTSIKDFMARVVPWPGDGPGFVNIHWTNPAKDGSKRVFWGGRPTRTLDEFMTTIGWAANSSYIKDIYYCMSMQREAGVNRSGKPKPERTAANALALKAIWLDVDVKAAPKGYPTLLEAIKAVTEFREKFSLPAPSALVASGGGLHVYWISDKPLTVAEWTPYASGLKAAALQHGLRCDALVTGDCARVLRVPGTSNHKTDPAKPVKLLALGDDYDFAANLAGLCSLTPPHVAMGAAVASPFGDAADLTVAPEFLAEPMERLGERSQELLDPAAVLKECPFLMKSLRTGGKDNHEPLWHLTTLISTWLEDGHTLAHKMANQHDGYGDGSGTDEKWQRALQTRKDRDLGWPSCATVQGSGCTECATCPRLSLGKSPLHAGFLAQATAAVTAATPPDLCLPKGYALNQAGVICKIVMEKGEKGAPPTVSLLPLFKVKLSEPWSERGHPDKLNFQAVTSKGHETAVSLPMHELVGNNVSQNLAKRNVKIEPENKRHLEGFLVAWIDKLHQLREAQTSVAMGWTPTEDGFAYSGKLWKKDGTVGRAGSVDPVLGDHYQACGTIGPWMRAKDLILNQERIGLTLILVAAFAGPLIRFAAVRSSLLSLWGFSGAGKTAAVHIAAAVWGHPLLTTETPYSSQKGVMTKLMGVRHLPVFWDEIKDMLAQKKVSDTVFGPGGVGGSKLYMDGSLRIKGEWQTLLTICSNASMYDFLRRETPSTSAGINRMLEIKVPERVSDKGRIDSTEASQIIQDLDFNYGGMGMKYAELLASDPEGYKQLVLDVSKRLREATKSTSDGERIWIVIAATMIVGAMLANKLGVGFPVKEIEECMVDAIYHNRDKLAFANVEGGSAEHTQETMSEFFNHYRANTLYTDVMHTGAGKPKQTTVVQGPDPRNPKPIYIHCAMADRKIAWGSKEFDKFCKERTQSVSSLIDGLRTHFKTTISRRVLAVGTPYKVGKETVYTMEVDPGSPFEGYLMAHKLGASLEAVDDDFTATVTKPATPAMKKITSGEGMTADEIIHFAKHGPTSR